MISVNFQETERFSIYDYAGESVNMIPHVYLIDRERKKKNYINILQQLMPLNHRRAGLNPNKSEKGSPSKSQTRGS